MTTRRDQSEGEESDINVRITGLRSLLRHLNLNSLLIAAGMGLGGWGINGLHRSQKDTTTAVVSHEETRKREVEIEQKALADQIIRIVKQEQAEIVAQMSAKIDPVRDGMYRLEAKQEYLSSRYDDLSAQVDAIRVQIAATQMVNRRSTATQ